MKEIFKKIINKTWTNCAHPYLAVGSTDLSKLFPKRNMKFHSVIKKFDLCLCIKLDPLTITLLQHGHESGCNFPKTG